MKEILPVILFLFASICSAEDWIYTGSSKEFIPTSSQLGENWSRSLIRTVNEGNEFKNFFQSTNPAASGVTTNYEIFRKKNEIRELSEVQFYFEDSAQGKQSYQLAILLFPNKGKLLSYFENTHPEHLEAPVFTTIIEGNHSCIFRLQNIYVRVSSEALSTECERIAGLVFNMIQLKQKGSNQAGDDNSE